MRGPKEGLVLIKYGTEESTSVKMHSFSEGIGRVNKACQVVDPVFEIDNGGVKGIDGTLHGGRRHSETRCTQREREGPSDVG